jgi:DNA-binding CsgD family transcriptional regulator
VQERETTPTAVKLIRKLVAEAATDTSRISQDKRANGQQDVLFSADVDGVRCLIVKAAPESNSKIWFSPREREIARMVAKGYPNKTIAAVLDISVWTVATHLRRIFGKLGVNSRAAMVAQLSIKGVLSLAVTLTNAPTVTTLPG